MFAQHNQNNMHNWNFLVANACEHIQKQSIGKECHSTVFGGDFTVTCSSFTYNSELYLSASDFDRSVFFSHQGWYEHKKLKQEAPILWVLENAEALFISHPINPINKKKCHIEYFDTCMEY